MYWFEKNTELFTPEFDDYYSKFPFIYVFLFDAEKLILKAEHGVFKAT